MPKAISHREKSPTRIQSVARAVELLMLVASRPHGVSAAEAAASLGAPTPTAYHLLATLADTGLVVHEDQRFVLGPRAGALAEAHLRLATPPEHLTRPLRQLARATGETAYLTAWRQGEIYALASIEGSGALRVGGVPHGPYVHPHSRATGKLLLAFAPADRRREVLGPGPYEAVTDRTITEPARLELELAEIRERGWAEEREEFAAGVACVSAPVLIDRVAVFAYTVSAPVQRFDERRKALLAAVQEAAACVTPAAHRAEAS